MSNSTQYAVRNTQSLTQSLKVSKTFKLLLAICALTSCGPKTDDEQFYVTPVPRLTKYYDAIENGDTLFKIVPVDTFINQNGRTFSTAELKGNISVVQLFFTSCEGICPVISNNMALVQKEFAGNDNVNLVSYSVDPARDSVPALKKYCTRFSCDSTQWSLVTGDKKKIYNLIRYGYQLPDVEPGSGDAEDFIHSDQIVLVDRNSIIRGYYGGTDTAQVRMLIEDIHILINEK